MRIGPPRSRSYFPCFHSLSAVCLALMLLVCISPVRSEEQAAICRDLGHLHESQSRLATLAGHALDDPDGSAGPVHRYAPDRHVDVLHLKLDVTPDFDAQTVTGTATITFSPIAKPLRELRLDAIDLSIRDVRSDAGITDHTSTRKDLTIVFARDINVGERIAVEIDYHAQPRKGLYFRTPAMGYPETDTHIWTQGEPHEASHWFPCHDFPNERSSTEIICRVPRDMVVFSNGAKAAEWIDEDTGLKAVRWAQDKPHVTYLICLVAGHFKTIEDHQGSTSLAFHTQPSLAAHAANAFRDTRAIMNFFEKEIGVAYPWDKYDQVTISDFMWGGMENTSLTTLTQRTIFTDASENIRSSHRLDAHELAHQWFGDLVTCKDWSHLWLNEGFATFYTHLYEGHKFGNDHKLYGLYRDANRRVLSPRSNPKPIVYNEYKTAREQFDYRAYPKGSWVLHMLREQLGDDLFRKCIHTYLERHKFTSVVTEDLNKVVEELSGQSFDGFFDQWVYHAAHPTLDVSYRYLPGKKLAKVTVRQTQEVNDDVLLFQFPTTLRFVVDGQVIDHDIKINRAQQDYYVPLPGEPQIVRFDPAYSVLATVSFDKTEDMLLTQLNSDYAESDVIGRLLAVEALGERKTQRAIEALAVALREDAFYGVRLAASQALGDMQNEDAFEALVASMKQDDARVRQQVVEDLGGFYRDETLGIMLQVARDEHNPEIKADAIQALGRFHGQPAQGAIRAFLYSNSFRNQLADAAVSAIRMQDDDVYIEDLMVALERRGDRFTSFGLGRALDTLARIARKQDDRDEVRQFIAAYLNNPKETLRIAAIGALAELGDIKAAAILEPLASGPQEDRLADAARDALGQLRQTAPLAPRELVELREAVAELHKSNRTMRESVDELRAQLEATQDKTTTVASDAP